MDEMKAKARTLGPLWPQSGAGSVQLPGGQRQRGLTLRVQRGKLTHLPCETRRVLRGGCQPPRVGPGAGSLLVPRPGLPAAPCLPQPGRQRSARLFREAVLCVKSALRVERLAANKGGVRLGSVLAACPRPCGASLRKRGTRAFAVLHAGCPGLVHPALLLSGLIYSQLIRRVLFTGSPACGDRFVAKQPLGSRVEHTRICCPDLETETHTLAHTRPLLDYYSLSCLFSPIHMET